MELKKEQIELEIKEKQANIQKINALIDNLRDGKSRILGQIDYLTELLKKELKTNVPIVEHSE